jgi:hypothetical protein
VVPLYRLSPWAQLHGLPGPLLHKITELPMLYHALFGTATTKVRALHDKYGRVVQTGSISDLGIECRLIIVLFCHRSEYGLVPKPGGDKLYLWLR